MKSILLCIKIHLPVIHHQYQFLKINQNSGYFDDLKTKSHTQFIVRNNLIPFLDAIQNLSYQFGDRFKVALSISGISLFLLEKYAPQTIYELKQLSKRGCIDFLAETWSHSILPYFDPTCLEQQTQQHRNAIRSIFGKTPTAFIGHSPECANDFLKLLPSTQCKTTILPSNQILKEKQNRNPELTRQNQNSIFIINQKISREFQLCSGVPGHNNRVATVVNRYLRKHATMTKPLVVVFNPLSKELWFDSISARRWQDIITFLFNHSNVSFYSTTDLNEMPKKPDVANEFSESMLSNIKLQDYWLKNELQKETFQYLRNINNSIRKNGQPNLTICWNFLQDMNNLYYMNNQFFSEEYSRQNFSPFQSPYEAFMNYMNILDDFAAQLKQNNNSFSDNYSQVFNLPKTTKQKITAKQNK